MPWEKNIISYKEDLDKRFINKILSLKSFNELITNWFSRDYLRDVTAKYCYDIIKDYAWISEQQLPPSDYVTLKLKEAKNEEIEVWTFEEEEEMSLPWLIEEVRQRHFSLELVAIHKSFTTMIKEWEKPEVIKNLIWRTLRELDFTSDLESNVVKFSDIQKRADRINERIKWWEDIWEWTISFPFSKWNEFYWWIQSKDLIFVVAPQKSWKTFLLNEFAFTWFKAAKKVLYISPEMKAEEILVRLDWALLWINYSKITNLNMTEEDMNKYKKWMIQYESIIERWWEIEIIDSAPSWFWLDFVIAMIDKHQPDMLIIDWLTLLSSDIWVKPDQDWLAAKKISEWLKNKICNAKQIPVVVAVQAKSDWDTVNTEILKSEHIARSTQMMQDCDIAFWLSKKWYDWDITKRIISTLDARRWVPCLVWIDFKIKEWLVAENKDFSEQVVKEIWADDWYS